MLVFQRFGVSTFIENSPFATSDDSKGGISEELSPILLHPKNESAKMKPRFSGSPIKEAWKTANEVKTEVILFRCDYLLLLLSLNLIEETPP